MDRDATQVYASLGLTFEQRWFGPLNQLIQNGAMTVGEIAERLGITHVSVSEAARSLENAGLVSFQVDASDRRRRLLVPTLKSESLIAELKPVWHAFERASAILDEEIGGIVAVLDRLDDALSTESLFERIHDCLNHSDRGAQAAYVDD